MSPRHLTQMPRECPCPLGFEEMWSGNLHTRVAVLAQGLSTGIKVNIYIKNRGLANSLPFIRLELSSKEGVNHKVFHLEPCTLFI